MKLKSAFTLSMIVNAVLLAAVAYIAFTHVELRNDPIIIINRSTPPEAPKSASTPAPDVASLPK